MPPEGPRVLELIDTHYGGDVSRIVVGGVGPIPGGSVRARRDHLQREADGLRRLLLEPPYGDPSMCVNLIVPPAHREAQAGFVIMEAMGYPHFSGSNSVCTVTALLESGRIPLDPEPGVQTVRLEAPSGLVQPTAEHDGRRVRSVAIEGGPAYVVARGRSVELPDHGRVDFDLVWSGCYYAVVDAAAHGFALTIPERPRLAAFAFALCLAATPTLDLTHPQLGDTGPLSFVCFAGPVERQDDGRLRAPSATYVHPGVICSCPTGTGTSARLAVMQADGAVGVGDRLETVSPGGSAMLGTLIGLAEVNGRPAVRSTIAGRAFVLARSRVVVDPEDALVKGAGLWGLLVDEA